ncbi:hypothetical protein Ahy_B10g105573 [Arachis hypogaea]|uniref:SWIM-type domain-containing protein n=1 Tax=Arachis hypogaea TaxID=3818 RepID=A0A444X8C2_ARAHY|nr:hypothetical protein Ahy_B10g105573 [Arachis hypogaea]
MNISISRIHCTQDMQVTHCDRRASVEEIESVDGWSQTSYRVRLTERTCDCGLFQSLHYPCRHALAACAAARVRCTLETQLSHAKEGIGKAGIHSDPE